MNKFDLDVMCFSDLDRGRGDFLAFDWSLCSEDGGQDSRAARGTSIPAAASDTCRLRLPPTTLRLLAGVALRVR